MNFCGKKKKKEIEESRDNRIMASSGDDDDNDIDIVNDNKDDDDDDDKEESGSSLNTDQSLHNSKPGTSEDEDGEVPSSSLPGQTPRIAMNRTTESIPESVDSTSKPSKRKQKHRQRQKQRHKQKQENQKQEQEQEQGQGQGQEQKPKKKNNDESGAVEHNKSDFPIDLVRTDTKSTYDDEFGDQELEAFTKQLSVKSILQLQTTESMHQMELDEGGGIMYEGEIVDVDNDDNNNNNNSNRNNSINNNSINNNSINNDSINNNSINSNNEDYKAQGRKQDNQRDKRAFPTKGNKKRSVRFKRDERTAMAQVKTHANKVKDLRKDLESDHGNEQDVHDEDDPVFPMEEFAIMPDERLGRGATGVVVKAFHLLSCQVVAIKVLIQKNKKRREIGERNIYAYSYTYIIRIVEQITTVQTARSAHKTIQIQTDQEICVLENMKDSKYIIDMIGYGKDRDTNEMKIALEYMDGGSLKDYISNNSNVPCPESIVKYASYSILQALKELHQHRYVHNDIKPGNILYSLNGDIKLSDFGTVIKLDIADSLLTINCGTAKYLAPEKDNNNRVCYNTKADVWSFGLTIYELCTGAFIHPDTLPSSLCSNPPKLNPQMFTKDCCEFVRLCLTQVEHINNFLSVFKIRKKGTVSA
ncbi:hypothetical protein RFI_20786 [Reticulomyxa filosa]|uniref:mitogen-activated protein kinase kinase n=1 Tax=Reticulomyxa filosa TaxID=46433 RepID=X6MTV5_RETFI|nr:hypothetical protein RFI_20786 [Reticulomyxa filosa]|eukprot:ETO16555.1 hypothetical protein RFI_20786 [Reticulomyxa filosa]